MSGYKGKGTISPVNHSVTDAILISITTLIIVVGLTANSIIIKLTTSYDILKGRMAVYIVNQSVCNICLSAIPTLAYLIERGAGVWLLGDIVCDIVVVAEYLVITTSNALLVIICVEQYTAVSKPLRIRLNRSKKIPVITSWLLGLIIATPFVLIDSRYSQENGRKMCDDLLAFNLERRNGSSLAYFIAVSAITYVVPLFAMVYLYARMIRILLTSKRPGETSATGKFRAKRRKLNTIKMLITNLVLFQICWLPSYLQEFLLVYYVMNPKDDRTKNVNVSVSLLGYAYAAISPFVYFIFMKKYRNAFSSQAKKIRQAVRCASATGGSDEVTKTKNHNGDIEMAGKENTE